MNKRRYPGIAPFDSSQKELFFGRENDIRRIEKLILLREQVLFYSKSGLGKTSLLNAGVIPNLEDKFHILKIRFFAFDNEKTISPVENLKQSVSNLKKSKASSSEAIVDKLDKDSTIKDTLWYRFKKFQLLDPERKPFLLVFDQFEELFTYPDNQIKEFKEQLFEILKVDFPDSITEFISRHDALSEDDIDQLTNDLNIKAIYAIRSDRLSYLNQLSDKLPDIQETFYELSPLNKEQAKNAVSKPAELASDFISESFIISEPAINAIINALVDKKTQEIETTQLQIICQKIENIAINKQGRSKDQVIIENSDLPKFHDILLDFYLDVVEKSSKDIEEDRVREFVESQLIRNGQRISLDEQICLDYLSKKSLDTLVNLYLLRAEQNSTGGYSYEVSHDSLIAAIEQAMEMRLEKEALELEKKRQSKGYLLINILQAPVIAVILAFVLHSYEIDVTNKFGYTFYSNPNITFYFFCLAIIFQYLGISMGSGEISRDLKFSSGIIGHGIKYFGNKLLVLSLIAGIQAFLFVLIGNLWLEVRGMLLSFWIILTSSAITAILIGLLVNYLLKNRPIVNTIIALVIVAQIFLGGYLMNSRNINPVLSPIEFTPVVSDLMPAKWVYEGMVVKQFRDNKYEKLFYEFDQERSNAGFLSNFWAKQLMNKLYTVKKLHDNPGDNEEQLIYQLNLINNELNGRLQKHLSDKTIREDYKYLDKLYVNSIDTTTINQVEKLINSLSNYYSNQYREAYIQADEIRSRIGIDSLQELQRNYANEELRTLVTNRNSYRKQLEHKGRLMHISDDIYRIPESKLGRAHLYAPMKRIGGLTIHTYWFNLIAIWFMNIVLLFALLLTSRIRMKKELH